MVREQKTTGPDSPAIAGDHNVINYVKHVKNYGVPLAIVALFIGFFGDKILKNIPWEDFIYMNSSPEFWQGTYDHNHMLLEQMVVSLKKIDQDIPDQLEKGELSDVKRWVDDKILEEEALLEEENGDEEATNNHNKLATLQFVRGGLYYLEFNYQKALDYYQYAFENDDRGEMKARYKNEIGTVRLGMHFSTKNNADNEEENNLDLAKVAFNEAIAINKDHEVLAASHNNLGKVWIYKDRGKKARGEFNKAIVELKKDSGAEGTFQIAKIYNNLGAAYDLDHNCEQAIIEYTKALDIYDSNWRKNDDSTYNKVKVADTLSNMGMAKTKAWCKDYVGAKKDLKRALKIREDALGKTHPSVAWDKFQLAEIYKKSGDKELAIEELEESKKIFMNKFDIEHQAVKKATKKLKELRDSNTTPNVT